MKTPLLLAVTAMALFSIAGCTKSESPSKVDADVAKAADAAAEKDIKAEQKADSTSADAAADAAVTHAEGVNKVAREQCEALSGDAQKACKEKADAALDMAKADAKAMKAAHN